MSGKEYTNFKAFYPFYLSQHTNRTCRLLHVVGSTLIICMLLYSILSKQYLLLLTIPVIGYGFAWIGHFVFEKNVPATFQYPVFSLFSTNFTF